MRVLRLPPGLGGSKGRDDGNPMVVPKGTVPALQDGMGDVGGRPRQASVIDCLQPDTGSPKNGCAGVLVCRWHGGRDAGFQRVGDGKRGCEDDPR